MDTTDSRITFDENGVCDHCRTYDTQIAPSWNTGELGSKQLSLLADRIKESGRGKDFDCLIGMSGGIDSSYLTYQAKELMGLRPLVFHVDAGWNSQIAVNNIERLVDKLGLDLHTEVINWEEMRDLQLAFFKSGVSHIDMPQDHAFFATMYRFAAKHKIQHILTGSNYSTECVRNPTEWMYYQSDATQLLDIHRRFGTRPIKTFPTTNILWHKIWLPYVRGVKVSKPLNLFPYIKNDAMRLLESKFGWQPYPQKHFESRFTRFYESYWLPTRFGYDTRKVQYSSLILTKQMTRTEALAALAQPSLDSATIDQERNFVASKLSITTAELDSYLTMPLKTHRDYRSQRSLYSIGAAALRLFGSERGGKR